MTKKNYGSYNAPFCMSGERVRGGNQGAAANDCDGGTENWSSSSVGAIQNVNPTLLGCIPGHLIGLISIHLLS